MKLFSIVNAAEVELLQILIATGGVIAGHQIKVEGIELPSELKPDGRVLYNISPGGLPGSQQLLPRVVGCAFIEDDSLMTSVSYDNEKSLHETLGDIVANIKENNHEPRKLFLGQKEWDKLNDTNKMKISAKGHEFMGIKLVYLSFYPSVVIFEHGPEEVQSEDVHEEKED